MDEIINKVIRDINTQEEGWRLSNVVKNKISNVRNSENKNEFVKNIMILKYYINGVVIKTHVKELFEELNKIPKNLL